MKKVEKYIIIILILVVAVVSVEKYFFKKENKEEIPNSPTVNTPEESKIDKMLKNMTIEEKIGQMMMIAYRKSASDDNLRKILEEVKPGGFILFGENITTYDKSMAMINEIIDSASIPMFISIDQEGGRVQRIRTVAGVETHIIPSMYQIGKTSEENAYNTGALIASDLTKFKINMDMAPVLDVYSNPYNTVIGDRSFGNDPYLVSKMGLTLAKGLQDNSIIPVYKHFPGHGDTSADSHYELPVVKKTKEELLNLEIIPFKNAIENGAEVIMIGHLAVPNITNDNTPASLSKELITDFLRTELNYQNIVITDALNMKAITDNYTDKEIYNLAINAGVDILLMPNNPTTAINIIKTLIEENSITEDQINNSVKKILSLKEKYNIL